MPVILLDLRMWALKEKLIFWKECCSQNRAFVPLKTENSFFVKFFQSKLSIVDTDHEIKK